MSRKAQSLQMVRQLLKEADITFKKNPERAHHYVKMARKIAMKVNLKLPSSLKKRFCKHCYHYLKQGINARTRIHKSRIIIFCKDCKNFTRIRLK
ncbi:MAG: ribonuclease P [Candidatus Woesearchaeota archaeon]|nr:MAG: ribonuclease P [Candidatus Woesearchaeota archaeon]